MIYENLRIRFEKLFRKKRNNSSDYDYKPDINKSFEKFIEANEQYLLVASKFFSTSIDEDENSLRQSAEDVIHSYVTVELFTIAERLNFFHKSSDKITNSLDEIAELMFWIDKKDKKTISDIERSRVEYGDVLTQILYLHVPLENRFLNLITGYTMGMTIILISYFEYIVEQLFTDISLPSAIENFKKRHRLSRLWLLLPFFGLGLTILGFVPILSIVTGIVGLIMFYVENYILAGKELRNLKKMPEAATKAQEELSALKLKIDVLRVIKDFVVNWDAYLPKSTVEIIDLMKKGQKIDPSILKSECDFLFKKFQENQSRNWPGIGNVLQKKENENKDKIEVRHKKRKRK